jgi:hypothetical protein
MQVINAQTSNNHSGRVDSSSSKRQLQQLALRLTPNLSKVNLGPVPNTTYDAWHYLVRKAKKTIDIAAFYVRLTDGSNYPPVAEGWQGAVSGQSNAHCNLY